MNTRLLSYFILILFSTGISATVFVPNGWAQSTDPLVCKFGKFEVLLGKTCIDKVLGDTPTAKQTGIINTVNLIIKLVLGIVMGLGLIAFVVAGYVYMTAGGNAQRIGTAKTMMGAAILGIVLAITAQLILNTISPQFAADIRLPFTR